MCKYIVMYSSKYIIIILKSCKWNRKIAAKICHVSANFLNKAGYPSPDLQQWNPWFIIVITYTEKPIGNIYNFNNINYKTIIYNFSFQSRICIVVGCLIFFPKKNQFLNFWTVLAFVKYKTFFMVGITFNNIWSYCCVLLKPFTAVLNSKALQENIFHVWKLV